ncbi:MAG: aminodeoxychorismate synthase, component I [Halioglobus sp.]|nr:aminodeoxychorismate synthase, component I [Halioglobus sp.]
MSKSVHLEEIPYRADSCSLYDGLRDLPGAAFLDSSLPHASGGRFDILTAQPLDDAPPQLAVDADETAAAAFFGDLRDYHRERFADIAPASADIPFCGGILGYLGYDCGNRLHGIDDAAPQPAMPASGLRAYDWCLVQDHLLRRAVLVTLPGVDGARRADLHARLRRPAANHTQAFALAAPFRANVDAAGYRQAFERIQAYIQAGDCYQVNLAQCFSAACHGDPFSAYRALRAVAAAPFSAYLALDDGGALLSLSPERFLALHGHRVETAPIKGTRPRHENPVADAQAAASLRDSVKDRAENLMIVDLLRNDLGRSCVPGSIHVDRLFEVQSFPTVHHLVSIISGELQPGRSAWELLRDSFPGGSITGAPKRRAMQVIAELETRARAAYCGSVLYVSADGRMDSNIAIRSLLCDAGQVHCWGGGGIVADSCWEAEYQETFDKVGRFLRVLEDLG